MMKVALLSFRSLRKSSPQAEKTQAPVERAAHLQGAELGHHRGLSPPEMGTLCADTFLLSALTVSVE